ncbi:MAG: PAS domain S-box protein [bacterium]
MKEKKPDSGILEELRESKRMLETLISNLPGVAYRCKNDQNWTMEFISVGCFDLTGYSADDLIHNKKLPYNDLIVSEDRERIWQEVEERVHKHLPFILEYRIRTADQKIKWVYEKGRGVFSNQQELLFLEGFITDITEEKRSHQVGNVVFQISKASYTVTSIDEFLPIIHRELGKILDTTNFFVAMYDKATNSITLPYHVDFKDKFASFPAGKTMTGHVIQEKRPILATEQDMLKLVEDGVIEMIGAPSKVWMGVPLMVNNEVIGVLVVQNYSDPKSYTEEDLDLLTFVSNQVAGLIRRLRAEEKLLEERAYLDQLYQSSTEAIVMIDNHGIVKSINKEFTRLFGYTQEDLKGKILDDTIVPKYLHDEGVRSTNRALTNERVEMESVRQHKNGLLIDVSILVTPIFIEGQIVGAYGIYRDITERKRIEKSLVLAKEKAEESDRLKSAFLSNMSHEIRTPMNAILGFSSLLSDPDTTPEEREEYINIIKERGNDLMRIISDIIDVAKIESGQLNISIKDCKVNQLMNDLHAVFKLSMQKQGKVQVDLRTSLESNDLDFTILSDPQRLRQVISNLLENAIKFTETGTIEFGYSIRNDFGMGKSIIFFVRDTGIGIPPEMHTVIFERFRQVDDSHTRKYGGTGLGLTICKNVVHLMGGDLLVESEVGKGTLFKLVLPMWTITPAKEEPSPAKPKILQQAWKDKVILVAEDEESNFTFLDHILKRTGVRLLWAKNGVEAVNMAHSEKVDLILMDIRMPGMDGYEATELIKKERKDLPVVAQTAYALKGEKELSISAGCDDYISKPIDIQELMTVLDKYLNR